MSNVITLYPTNTLSTSYYVKRDVRKLAAALMFKMQIPEGIALVHVIGCGKEHSNQQAIESWIMMHFSNAELVHNASVLDGLQKSLTHYLNNTLEDCLC